MYKFKYRTKRFRVWYKNWKRRIDSRFQQNRHGLSTFEEKSIRLWKLCLKDRDTNLTFNSMKVRQIEKDGLLMIFKRSGQDEYIMTIMNVDGDKKSVFEIHIPSPFAEKMVNQTFDTEIEKRMREAENSKKSIISDDIDLLILKKERELNKNGK